MVERGARESSDLRPAVTAVPYAPETATGVDHCSHQHEQRRYFAYMAGTFPMRPLTAHPRFGILQIAVSRTRSYLGVIQPGGAA
jgi:hypothetical protein